MKEGPEEKEIEFDEKDQGDESDLSLLPFRVEEKWIVDESIELVRTILIRSDLTPKDIRNIAEVLLALCRMPLTTEGVSIGLNIIYRLNDESSFCEMYVSEESFRLVSGGSVYDPAVGGDHFSDVVFEIESSSYRSGASEFELSDWFNRSRELLVLGAKISTEDNSNHEAVDWYQDIENDHWNELPGLDEEF